MPFDGCSKHSNVDTFKLERAYTPHSKSISERVEGEDDSISVVYTSNHKLPTEDELNYVAHECTKIMETKENYAILANKLINHILESSQNIEYQLSDTNIHNYICDCFADPFDLENNKEVEINDNAIRMFTKSNKKPSIKTLSRVAHNCEKVMKKMYQILKKSLIDKDIFKICSKFECSSDNSHMVMTRISTEISSLDSAPDNSTNFNLSGRIS